MAAAEQVCRYLAPSEVRVVDRCTDVMLATLSDLLATPGRGLGSPGARSYLSGLEGSSKAAVLAKSLTAHAPP